MFSDKTEHDVTMSKVITQYLDYIEELYQLSEDNVDRIYIDKQQTRKIRRKYKI